MLCLTNLARHIQTSFFNEPHIGVSIYSALFEEVFQPTSRFHFWLGSELVFLSG